MSTKHTPGPITEADIDAAREYIANVHNRAQMVNACSQLRPEVVAELAARGFVPRHYRTAFHKATGEQQ